MTPTLPSSRPFASEAAHIRPWHRVASSDHAHARHTTSSHHNDWDNMYNKDDGKGDKDYNDNEDKDYNDNEDKDYNDNEDKDYNDNEDKDYNDNEDKDYNDNEDKDHNDN
nr:phosphopantothenoylcysteine decarboxylase subunit VHS3-like [Penaeus vannamei]